MRLKTHDALKTAALILATIALSAYAVSALSEVGRRVQRILGEPKMAIRNWTSLDGDWEDGWDAADPVDGDAAVVGSISRHAMTDNLDRLLDSAGDGLALASIEFTRQYTGDVGDPSNFLKLFADKFIWRGTGRLYWVPQSTVGGMTCDRLIIDTPNLAHEIVIASPMERVAAIEFRSGRMTIDQGVYLEYIVCGGDNPFSESRLTLADGSWVVRLFQTGNRLIYKGAHTGTRDDEELVVAGGYCQFDGTARRFIQTGGHVDFGVEALEGTTPTITEAWLLNGSMDATKAVLNQAITTLYLGKNFKLTKDSGLTIGTQINVGGW